MTTVAPPQKVNGHPHALPVAGDWEAVAATPTTEAPPMYETEPAAPKADPIAEAEAEAIRARTYAEGEALRIKAQAEADATRAKSAAEAERLRLTNERNAMRLEKERAANNAAIAEEDRKREESERKAAAARTEDEELRQATASQVAEIAEADERWRKYALRFAIVCGVVALPVQMAAFWNPSAPWLLVAPLMLEGGAWVVLRGAAAAVVNRRPLWHYRTIAWLLAFVASAVNLWHGMNAFDPATAIATAFASLAGPGVWDLHEHGRIRKRDGVLSRKERRALRKAEESATKEKAAEEKRRATEKAAAQKAERETAAALTQARERDYPNEWKYAVRLASAMGATTVTEAVWERAWSDLHAAKPGVTVNSVSGRNIAQIRMARALEKSPENTPSKVTNAQRASQMPTVSKPRVYNPPARAGKRRPGDTPKYVSAARTQAAITARKAASSRGDEQK